MDVAIWQIINFAIFIGVIYVIVKLVKNSNKTVKLLTEIETKLKDLSEKVDTLFKK